MIDWIKRLFSKSSSERLPGTREAQSDWIKAKFEEWQTQWHDIFDTDQQLIDLGEFERPDPLPTDIDGDYRLIFGLSQATVETRFRCFSLFPEGEEMHRRFDAFLTTRSVPLSEVDARKRVEEVIASIKKIGPNEEVDFSNIKVVDRDTDEGFSAIRETDSITVLLERSLLKPHRANELSSAAARLFLTEPLYASAGNYYHVCDWVTSAMFGGQVDELQTQLCQLWQGGWLVLLDGHGVVLAHREV